MSFPVAIQLYSLRNEAAADFFGVLEKVKEMGYDGVEFAGLHGRTPAEIREKCAELGLVPISAHVALKEMLTDPRGVLGAYREIGFPRTVRRGQDSPRSSRRSRCSAVLPRRWA